jgi:hypothetical protein
MDIKIACNILDINEKNLTEKTIKKAYFKQALIWHPDKNKSPNSLTHFQKIQESYIFLKKQTDIDCENDNSNSCDGNEKEEVSFIVKLINVTTGVKIDSVHMKEIINELKRGCEDVAFRLIAKLDKITAVKIYNFIKQHYFIFGLDSQCINRLEKIICVTEIITLTPTLENLFNCDIYNLEVEPGSSYCIPLWHDELEFHKDRTHLLVVNEPLLPKNILIDGENNVHVNISFNINEIIGKDNYIINIASREFIIEIQSLFIKPKQDVHFKYKGIPKINLLNMFDITELGDVIIHIELK